MWALPGQLWVCFPSYLSDRSVSVNVSEVKYDTLPLSDVFPPGFNSGSLALSFFLSYIHMLSLGQTLVDEVDSLFIFMTMAFGCTGLLKLTGMMNCLF